MYVYFLALFVFLSFFFFLERILFTMIGGIVREKEIRKIVVKLKERREKNCSMKFASWMARNFGNVFFFLRHKARSSSPFHPVFKLLFSFFFPPLSNRHYFIIYFHRLTDFSFFTQKHTDPYTFVAHFVGTRFFLRLGCCEDARMKGSRSLRLLREMVYLCLNTYDTV